MRYHHKHERLAHINTHEMKLTIPYARSEPDKVNCGISIQFNTTQQLKEKNLIHIIPRII